MISLAAFWLVVGALNGNSTDYIVSVTNIPDQSTGTGFFIDKNHVLTAEHVVNGYKKVSDIEIECLGEKQLLLVKKIIVDEITDIALLETDGICKNQKILPLALKNEHVSNDVLGIGCPDGRCGFVTKGIITGYLKNTITQKIELYSDIKIWYGSSGGPLLNEKGQVVGLLKQIDSQSVVLPRRGKIFEVLSQNYGVYVPVSEILEFLFEVQNAKGPQD